MDLKSIAMILGILLSGGGAFAIYADNGELRGDVKVLTYKVSDMKEDITNLETALSESIEAQYKCELNQPIDE